MIRSIFWRSLLTGAALAAATPAFADVKAGVEAWSRGDYAAAVAEWKGPAGKGDADAQFNLGQAYKLGRGVPQDLQKAEDLFAKASAQGHMQASDNYGLLLFQRGERARALPYISAAAERGDSRGQYLLGLAHFNGENVAKDWVRAYALVSLAQQAGLAQAVAALTEMDKHIPLDQRQQAVRLATQLAAEATANRARQLAALDLGASTPSAGLPRPSSMSAPTLPPGSYPKVPPAAGADYARPRAEPRIPPVADIINAPAPVTAPRRAPVVTALPSRKPLPFPADAARPPVATSRPAPPRPAVAAGGIWRVQLGAFAVPGNADALWNRVRNRPELAGHARMLVPAGRVTKLQAGGFASQADAQAACSRLTSAGFACIAVRN